MNDFVSRRLVALSLPLASCLLLAACAGTVPQKVVVHDDAPVRAVLAYYVANPRPAAESGRERGDPYVQMQLAIQAGQAGPGRTPDLPRALNLLEAVTRSAHPAAAPLAPLARVLHDQYGERLRLEQQLREAQRRSEQLQEKIDALSAIERSLPARPLPPAPVRGGARKGAVPLPVPVPAAASSAPAAISAGGGQ